jgi:hypothetical protein
MSHPRRRFTDIDQDKICFWFVIAVWYATATALFFV